MDPKRWERVEALFAAALERAPAERDAYLREESGGDEDLVRTVARMLSGHDEDSAYLETPVARVGDLDPGDLPVDPHAGPYRLVRPLGRGGMGEVHLAVHEGEGFQRPVAVKVIRRGMHTNDVLRRFRLERRILAGLDHPNIARLLDGGATTDGRPYFVMEYVDGLRIDEYCERHALSIEDRLRLVLPVCDAVQHAHQNLVVHRDLKPGNILVTAEGVPKLLDFGIGKLLDPDAWSEDEGMTRTGMRLLTPEYAAPEQVRGEPVSVATDVYGLGVLLYRLLTGHSPYGEEKRTPTEMERAVLEVDPRRPSTVAGLRRLAGDLDVIVLKALRKEPTRRYASVAALTDDLRRWLDGLPVRARGDSLGYRAGKFIVRNRVPVAAAGAVLLAVGWAGWSNLEQSRRLAVERDRALEVRTFLLEMFGATGPDQAAGDTVTARQLLDRQVALLETGYPDPVLRAEMTAVLAEGYDRLGLLADAEPLARSALELRRRSLGERHPDVARSLGLLGWILHQAGRSAEGETFLRGAVDIWRGARPDPVGLSRTLNDLGVVREAAGEYDEAEALYVEALELRRAALGEEHRAFAITASNLSVIRYRKGDLPGAVAAASEALRGMRGALGPDHQRSIIVQSNLAAMRSALGDDAGAEAEYRDLLARQERLRGRDDPVTIRVAASLGATLGNQARWAEAEPLFRRAVAAQTAQLGAAHPETGRSLSRLGEVVTRQGRIEEGRALIERSMEILGESVGRDHPAYASALEMLAGAWNEEDRGLTERLHREAIGILDARLGSENPTTAQARARLADRYRTWGRRAEALALYDSAHAVLAATLPGEHPQVHLTRVRLAELELAAGSRARGDSILRAAREAFARGGADAMTVRLADTLAAAAGGS